MYVPNGRAVNEFGEPQFLSEEDLMFVSDAIQQIEIPCRTTAATHYKMWYAKYIVRQLRKVKLVTSPDKIPLLRLISIISKKTRAGLLGDGEDVGITSAHSICSALTQATLNAFKEAAGSGLLVSGGGIKNVSDLLFVRVKPEGSPDRKMVMHFTTRFTPRDVIDLRSILVEINMDSIVDNDRSLIDYFSTGEGDEYDGQHSRQWWHDAFEISTGNIIKDRAIIYRIVLRPDIMYSHQITMTMVLTALQKWYVGQNVFMVASPLRYAYIDVIDNSEDTIANAPSRRNHFEETIRGEMKKIPIKGVVGISGVSPITINLIFMIGQEDRTPEGWYVEVVRNNDNINNAVFSCSIELEEMFDKCGILFSVITDVFTGHVVGYEIDTSRVILPPSEEKSKSREEMSDMEPSTILKIFDAYGAIKLDYTYAIVLGSNIREVTKFPWVDALRTTSNEITELYQILGCEASRAYFLFELEFVLDYVRCGDVNPRHMTTMADIIYHQGQPHGLKLSGNYARKQDTILQMNNQQCAQVLAGAALSSTVSSTQNVATALAVGQNPNIANVYKYKTKESIEERERLYHEKLIKDKNQNFPNHLADEKRIEDDAAFSDFINQFAMGGTIETFTDLDPLLDKSITDSFVPSSSRKGGLVFVDSAETIPRTIPLSAEDVEEAIPDVEFPYTDLLSKYFKNDLPGILQDMGVEGYDRETNTIVAKRRVIPPLKSYDDYQMLLVSKPAIKLQVSSFIANIINRRVRFTTSLSRGPERRKQQSRSTRTINRETAVEDLLDTI